MHESFVFRFSRSIKSGSCGESDRVLVAKLKEKGQPVVYVKVKRMTASRLEGLSLEVA